MKIIVTGAGELGRLLASALSEEKHDIVLVDSDTDELARISDKIDDKRSPSPVGSRR